MENTAFPSKKIMIIGPQGSGKTTQAKILAGRLGIKYLGTGEMFREIMQKGEPGWEWLKKMFDEGKMADDITTCRLVQEKLQQPEYQSGVVVDGYPRTIEQKNIFDPDFDIVLYIKISDEIATKRLLERGRFDDTKEAISERLELYHQETGPLLDIFLNEGKLWIVDGEQPVEAVTGQIDKHLSLDL